MVRSGLRFIAIVGLAIALSGCNTNNNDRGSGTGTGTGTGMKQQAISNNRTGVTNKGWDNPRNNNFSPMHNNSKMEISNKIADAITAMDEVDTATVLLSNQNAYVAVVLDNGTGYGTSSMGNGTTGDNGPRMTPNAAGNNATTNRMGRRGSGAGDEGVTDDLKESIAQRVRSVNPNVNNVYVSANADFVGRMRGYGERFQNGQPIRGMIIEFNNLVKRIFPQAE
jgi:YhcN/YlaJ family sporulation lipoprotein